MEKLAWHVSWQHSFWQQKWYSLHSKSEQESMQKKLTHIMYEFF
jgi:hypothetical protein